MLPDRVSNPLYNFDFNLSWYFTLHLFCIVHYRLRVSVIQTLLSVSVFLSLSCMGFDFDCGLFWIISLITTNQRAVCRRKQRVLIVVC